MRSDADPVLSPLQVLEPDVTDPKFAPATTPTEALQRVASLVPNRNVGKLNPTPAWMICIVRNAGVIVPEKVAVWEAAVAHQSLDYFTRLAWVDLMEMNRSLDSVEVEMIDVLRSMSN